MAVSTHSTINAFRRLLFGLQGRSERQFQLVSGKILHIAGALSVDMEEVSALANSIPESRCWSIDTSFYKGCYISIDREYSVLIIQPKTEKISLGSEEFNQSIEGQLTEELLAIAEDNIHELQQIHFGIFWGIVEIYLNFLSYYFDLSIEQLNNIKLINTHNHLASLYRNLVEGRTSNKNLYIDIFSQQYFIEIQIISKLFDRSIPVNIHDVATNSANLPNLLNLLATKGSLPFHLGNLECSDYNIFPAMHNINVISKKLEYICAIKVTKVDLTNSNISFANANVIVANDVLEHFDESDSFRILLNLWNHTVDVLIIHVPIETTLAHHFGHLTYFTQEKLNLWSKKLPHCLNLTEELLSPHKDHLSIDGFLVLRKENKSNG